MNKEKQDKNTIKFVENRGGILEEKSPSIRKEFANAWIRLYYKKLWESFLPPILPHKKFKNLDL